MNEKTLSNTSIRAAKKAVPDIKVVGDGDTWKLICKASSKSEGWMKSTKAMDVDTGVVIQVTTQQGDHVAEALVFVPGVRIIDGCHPDEGIERRIGKRVI